MDAQFYLFHQVCSLHLNSLEGDSQPAHPSFPVNCQMYCLLPGSFLPPPAKAANCQTATKTQHIFLSVVMPPVLCP